MSFDQVPGGENRREKWIGVYIGILAVLLAIVTVGGGNAAKDATARNIEASNLWAFFQAKNMRRTSYQLAADELEILMTANPAWPSEVRAGFESRLGAYREQITRLTSDKQRNEGLDELFERAKAVEAARDTALRKDPYFDYAQAALQIAIVLASVAIISGGNVLLALSMLLAVGGGVLGLNGFLLFASVPYID